MNTDKSYKELLEKLYADLDKQIELSGEVLSITRAEKEALVNMDTDSLFGLARSKSDKLDLIAEEDRRIRQNLIEITSDFEAGQGDPVKLLDILPLLEGRDADRIKEKRNKLVELRKKIINDNVVNKKFTTDVLGHLEDAVSLIVNGIQGSNFYNRQKRGTIDNSRPSLLSREI